MMRAFIHAVIILLMVAYVASISSRHVRMTKAMDGAGGYYPVSAQVELSQSDARKTIDIRCVLAYTDSRYTFTPVGGLTQKLELKRWAQTRMGQEVRLVIQGTDGTFVEGKAVIGDELDGQFITYECCAGDGGRGDQTVGTLTSSDRLQLHEE